MANEEELQQKIKKWRNIFMIFFAVPVLAAVLFLASINIPMKKDANGDYVEDWKNWYFRGSKKEKINTPQKRVNPPKKQTPKKQLTGNNPSGWGGKTKTAPKEKEKQFQALVKKEKLEIKLLYLKNSVDETKQDVISLKYRASYKDKNNVNHGAIKILINGQIQNLRISDKKIRLLNNDEAVAQKLNSTDHNYLVELSFYGKLASKGIVLEIEEGLDFKQSIFKFENVLITD
ncbi:MAG: hypothetical protein HRT89_14980 [Lentisphaeria bacterium]|nr:hypothetical protein [Lentisphaeria bacterium]NQZ69364.1 hypothetical protein [Lentisphaeria bacterium]